MNNPENKAAESGSSRPIGSVVFCGNEYPIISELEGGFYLVAHPNGPAICGHDWLSGLDAYDDDSPRTKQLKRLAIKRFREWAWSNFYSQNVQEEARCK